MRGTTRFKRACLGINSLGQLVEPNPKYRTRIFINFNGAGTWIDDDQNPNTTNFPDVAPFLVGDFRLSGTELEGVLVKSISRKTNFNLKNLDRIFDYRVFNDIYDPTNLKFNGPYDADVYTITGKKIGNIRSGRKVIVQIGVYDTEFSIWRYLDKFRGITANWEMSQNDRTVQLTVEDQSLYLRQIKTQSYYYVGRTFKEIFEYQAGLHGLGLPSGKIKCFDITEPYLQFVFPFVFMPEVGEYVWSALEKLCEVVAAKMDFNEIGELVCRSRLYEGDQIGQTMDQFNTITNDDYKDIRDTFSTTRLFNQSIINQVVVTSNPMIPDVEDKKCWKFKVFYNEQNSRNEGYLKPGRYFGDVWANNITIDTDYTNTPIEGIDRDDDLDLTIKNELYTLDITSDPYISGPDYIVNVVIQKASEPTGHTWTGTMTCGAENALGGLTGNELDGVFVYLADYTKIKNGYKSEIQIGIIYYASFGDFKVISNNENLVDPTQSKVYFEIHSFRRNPDPLPGEPLNWSDEKIASTFTGDPKVANNNYSDRVVMALKPGETDYNTGNVFFLGSKEIGAWDRIPLLFVNRDTWGKGRWVSSLEIFGRRIVESKNTTTTIKAPETVINAFGGEQVFTLENNFIPTIKQSACLGRFIVDNYSTPRDIPKLTVTKPRPYWQVGDRIKIQDVYTGLDKQFVIRNFEEIFRLESFEHTIDTREADTDIWTIMNSQAELGEAIDKDPLITLSDSADVGNGQLDVQEQPKNDFTWRFNHDPAIQGELILYLTCTTELKKTAERPYGIKSTDIIAKYINNDVIAQTDFVPVTDAQNSFVIKYSIDNDFTNHTGNANFNVGINGDVITINNKVAQGSTSLMVANAITGFIGIKAPVVLSETDAFPVIVSHGCSGIPYNVKARIRFHDTGTDEWSNWFPLNFSTSYTSDTGVGEIHSYRNHFYMEIDDTNIKFHADSAIIFTSDWGDHTGFGWYNAYIFSAANKTHFYVKNSAGVLVNTWDKIQIAYNVEN